MTTDKQIAANRENAKSGAVRTPEGKAASRLNARKHGIFASALTEQDKEELHAVYPELADWFQPVGPVESMLVEKLAVAYVRLQRCALAEAEHHGWVWELPPPDSPAYRSPRRKGPDSEEQLKPTFRPSRFERAAELFGRYDVTLTNQFLKLLHEIERLQRMRAGEDVAPPIIADLTVHGREDDGVDRTGCVLRNEPNLS